MLGDKYTGSTKTCRWTKKPSQARHTEGTLLIAGCQRNLRLLGKHGAHSSSSFSSIYIREIRSFCPSVSLTLCLALCQSLSLFVLSLFLSLFLSLSACLSFSLCLSLCLSISLSLVSVCLSCLSLSVSVSLSLCLSLSAFLIVFSICPVYLSGLSISRTISLCLSVFHCLSLRPYLSPPLSPSLSSIMCESERSLRCCKIN